MRAFLAVEIASVVRAAITVFQEELGERAGETLGQSLRQSLRWIRPGNLHLTLRFLGEVEPRALSVVRDALRDPVHDCKPFTYSLTGGGCFPSVKRARVIWIGVDPVPPELRRLHSIVEGVVGEHGFAPEGRAFNPHLTVARLKTPTRAAAALVTALEGRAFGETDVSELVLFESRLCSRGANYHAVERFELHGAR